MPTPIIQKHATKLLMLKATGMNKEQALYHLAERYNLFYPQNDKEAVALYYEAAKLGHAEAQYKLANAYIQGKGVNKKDEHKAAIWYNKAAKQYHAGAKQKLEELKAMGVDITKSSKVSANKHPASPELFLPAQANKGKEPAKEELPEINLQDNAGTKADIESATISMQELTLNTQSISVEQEINEDKGKQVAEEPLEQDADQNNAEELFKLAKAYKKGLGVQQDDNIAARHYYTAAKLGHLEAQYRWAEALRDGYGVQTNRQQALKWFSKAARQNHCKSQMFLATAYEFGSWGLEKNEKNAACWFFRAAQQGKAIAQYQLGVAYAQGKGIEKNGEKAVLWYQKAAAQGYLPAERALAAADMLGQDVNVAQTTSRPDIPSHSNPWGNALMSRLQIVLMRGSAPLNIASVLPRSPDSDSFARLNSGPR